MSNDLTILEQRSLPANGQSHTLLPEPAAPQTKETDGHQFLRLKLFSNITALLPMQQLSEVLTIPVGQVVPIPNMPAWVIGIYNWRGDILWIVDLSHFLGLITWNNQPSSIINHTIAILNVNAMEESSSSDATEMIGLVVNKTEDIERCNLNEIQSSTALNVNPTLAQFLKGYWLNPSGEMLAVLDGHAMLSGMQANIP